MGKSPYRWSSNPKGRGILVAADARVEWLLPWWWSAYHQHNRLPVTFADIGLSEEGRRFCEQRGVVISAARANDLGSICAHTATWARAFGSSLLDERRGWFKKPFAFLTTPFEHTLWLDVDCEVLQPLDSVFASTAPISLAEETEGVISRERRMGIIHGDEMVYNSGVVPYRHGLDLIERWVDLLITEEMEFLSDQHALSRLIYRDGTAIARLDERYNWRVFDEVPPDVAIVHWNGPAGKDVIRRHGGLKGKRASSLPTTRSVM